MSNFRLFTMPCIAASVLLLSSIPAAAQFYKLHNAEAAVGGTGQFTTSLTSQSQTRLPHQATTDSAGFLLSLADHPFPFAGIQLNYGFSRFSERFTSAAGVGPTNIPVNLHEATAAYLFHPHFRRLQPFIGIGGGALYFDPYVVHIHTQLRASGLFEVGLDIPTSNPHLGFRLQGRSLQYRAPNFNNPALSSSRWVATSEPSASVYLRY